MTDTTLQTEELTKRFGARTAVDRLSMRVERGDMYGFLGPNGAEVDDAENVVGLGSSYVRWDQIPGAHVGLGLTP